MAATTNAASTAVTPAEAIRVAVLQRLGVPGVAEVTHVRTKVADEAGLVAEPEATARLGKPARFVLSAGGVRRGVAVATVTVVCLTRRRLAVSPVKRQSTAAPST